MWCKFSPIISTPKEVLGIGNFLSTQELYRGCSDRHCFSIIGNTGRSSSDILGRRSCWQGADIVSPKTVKQTTQRSNTVSKNGWIPLQSADMMITQLTFLFDGATSLHLAAIMNNKGATDTDKGAMDNKVAEGADLSALDHDRHHRLQQSNASHDTKVSSLRLF